MIQRAWDYMKLNKMIEKGDRIVIGVSGGADSVCLLHVLTQICEWEDAKLEVVHINHGIRGDEADRDELFVENLCKELALPYQRFFYEVKKLASEQGLSEEEAGRKVRYEAFLETCEQKGCNKIAIAHNKNDNAETVLFHMLRGSGLKGLSGIDPMRRVATKCGDITLIRPLLFANRSEIEEYLKENQLLYVTDSTNLTEDYTRNKIRNKILNYAEAEINSAAIDHINESALMLKETLSYISKQVRQCFQRIVRQQGNQYQLSIKMLKEEDPVIQKGIVYEVLKQLAGSGKDLEAKHVALVLSLLEMQVGRSLHLKYQIVAEREYEDLRLCQRVHEEFASEETPFDSFTVEIPGEIWLPSLGKVLETGLISYKKEESVPKSSCVKWFDYDKIENAVEIRTRREGDFLQVNALGGRKKLKDYFIDQKIPKKQRDSQLLITDGNHVMWIPTIGDRISEKYKVDETTKRVLLMKLIDLEDLKHVTKR